MNKKKKTRRPSRVKEREEEGLLIMFATHCNSTLEYEKSRFATKRNAFDREILIVDNS